ncbi:hypothetical protein C8J57DRAFT_1505930 [Mycena rebaudengoi]|nr:hypothetical protein C8J57DRAFT_1505930 [Mycena rebaudengoi]
MSAIPAPPPTPSFLLAPHLFFLYSLLPPHSVARVVGSGFTARALVLSRSLSFPSLPFPSPPSSVARTVSFGFTARVIGPASRCLASSCPIPSLSPSLPTYPFSLLRRIARPAPALPSFLPSIHPSIHPFSLSFSRPSFLRLPASINA